MSESNAGSVNLSFQRHPLGMPNRFGRQAVVVAEVCYAWVECPEASGDQFVTCLRIQGEILELNWLGLLENG